MFYVTPRLRFRFAHTPGGKRWKKVTLCHIENKPINENDWFPIVMGIACCSKEDSFSRETGRKLSLTRALKKSKMLINKDTRTKIWETYFSKVNDLKKRG